METDLHDRAQILRDAQYVGTVYYQLFSVNTFVLVDLTEAVLTVQSHSRRLCVPGLDRYEFFRPDIDY